MVLSNKTGSRCRRRYPLVGRGHCQGVLVVALVVVVGGGLLSVGGDVDGRRRRLSGCWSLHRWWWSCRHRVDGGNGSGERNWYY